MLGQFFTQKLDFIVLDDGSTHRQASEDTDC